MATLVYSSIGRDRSSILSLTNDFKSINKLMNCIFHLKSSERVIISNNLIIFVNMSYDARDNVILSII